MRRWRRIAVELLGPPLIASVLLSISASLLLLDPTALVLLPVLLVGAYPLAAIPSVLFTLVLEIAFSRGLDPASPRTVRLAAVLGVLGGAMVAIPFALPPSEGLKPFAIFLALGAATGLALGAYVRWRSVRTLLGSSGASPRAR